MKSDIKPCIQDNFWSKYMDLVKNVVIPYQWEALNDRVPDAEPSYGMKNFKIAAGLEEGTFHGMVFQDSDLAKWLEAVGYSLQVEPDPELEKIADEVIDIIEKAQQEDGYLNTYFTLKEPDKRWTNLRECHELYCAGHMIEAAVSYYEATGKRKLLDVVCRFVDYIDTVFGPEPHKCKGYPGHEEIELALVKLYRVTGNERYLALSKYFIDERGKEPYYFDIEWEKRGRSCHFPGFDGFDRKYLQAHMPVRQQTTAEGHAVRATYLYSGMADIAAETGDQELFHTCKRLWDNIVTKKMYITGGIGSTAHGEAFTFDYDLPNDTVYAETCASIGLIFFAHRMLKMDVNSVYADVMERALYNTVISGISRDGRHFFYVNPLEVWPEACEKDKNKRHVKPIRQKWFACACCPPNVARMIASLPHYIYTQDKDNIYMHLYIGNETKLQHRGQQIALQVKTVYPWDGKVSVTIEQEQSSRFGLALRIPGWCRQSTIKVNGESLDVNEICRNGYAVIDRTWGTHDQVEIEFSMPVERIHSHPRVRENAGKVALQRGPLVYCLEEVDNGDNLPAISLPLEGKLEACYDKELLEGIVIIKGEGMRLDESSWKDDCLYRPMENTEKPVTITAVPYFIWGNRKPGEVMVWIRCK